MKTQLTAEESAKLIELGVSPERGSLAVALTEGAVKPAATNCPVTIRKKGTATLARILVRKKSAAPLTEARGEVWIAITSRAAQSRKTSSPP